MSERRFSALDLALAAALLAGTALYLGSLPRNLGHADEAFYLYHAKRIFDGQVVFRDFHELHMPLPHYAMALGYALFGVSMATATWSFAVLHGAIAVTIFGGARWLGVRRSLAFVAGLSHPAFCEPCWPHASPHWFATLGMMVVLLSLFERRRATAARGLVLPGVLTGLLFTAQHQNAVPIGVAMTGLLVLDVATAARCGEALPAGSWWRRPALYLAGVMSVIVGFLVIHGFLAGPGPVFEQLVLEPFTNYRAINGTSWGSAESLVVQLLPFTFLGFLRTLPLWLLPVALRFARAWSRRDLEALDRLGLLGIFAAASALSIWYYPDFIHIAYIAPPFLLLIAESVEAGLRSLVARGAAARPLSLATGLAAAGLTIFLGLHLRDNHTRFREWFPIEIQTEFGTVHVQEKREGRLIVDVRALLRTAEVKELVAYPVYISMYLMTGTHNPAPHDYVLPGYKTEAQILEVRDAIAERELRYVYVLPALTPKDDPVYRYVKRHYRCVRKGKGGCALYERLASGA